MIYLIYYKVKIDNDRWLEDNYEIIGAEDKLTMNDLARFRKTIIKQWGSVPVIMNIININAS